MAMACTASEAFRQWVCEQRLEGYRTVRLACDEDVERIRLEGESFLGEASFYDMGDGSEIAELRITRRADGETVFFLHFMMDDIDRAQELFGEMREALAELSVSKRAKVLLCCTCGLTTTMFANSMNEVARAFSLDYDF